MITNRGHSIGIALTASYAAKMTLIPWDAARLSLLRTILRPWTNSKHWSSGKHIAAYG